MKLTFIHNYKEGNSFHQQVETFTNVLTIEFEDQTNLDNGMWLNILFKEDGIITLNGKPTMFVNNETSIDFNPKWDWFTISE